MAFVWAAVPTLHRIFNCLALKSTASIAPIEIVVPDVSTNPTKQRSKYWGVSMTKFFKLK
jgi:hypothetical protein